MPKKSSLGPVFDSLLGGDPEDEPKRRGKKRKRDDFAELGVDSIRFETDEECKERYSFVIAQTLYVMGDGPQPYPENVDMALAITSSSLRYLLRDVTPAGENLLREILKRMSSRPDLIGRLLKHAEMITNLRSLKQREPQLLSTINDAEEESTDVFQNSPSTSNYFEEISSAVDSIKLAHSAKQLMNMNDPSGENRLARLAARVQKMDVDEYEALTNARQATFWTQGFDFNIRKNAIEKRSFLKWIGWEEAPQIVIFVLNFVAKETVKQFADFAVRVAEVRMNTKEKEPLVPFDPSIYQMAFLRSARAKNGDFVFAEPLQINVGPL